VISLWRQSLDAERVSPLRVGGNSWLGLMLDWAFLAAFSAPFLGWLLVLVASFFL
jgi:hypothetical protein